ncbi:MAG: hypothetical protein JXA78_18380 [Anaerolineales bacterium]|nr:hypothetical protein [Anaerolineales bacterium]
MKILAIIIAVLVALVLIAWVGTKIKPRPFPAFPQPSGAIRAIPLPGGLPAPVERFYRQVYGDQIPVIESAVITGRAVMRPIPGGPPLPARFRFIHRAGKDYRHYIEATFFGLPIMKVNERYVGGQSLFELPFGVVEDNPKSNQAAVLGLWAESAWFPSIFLTDPRVHWEPVDEHTALLYVPFEDQEENFVVRFDPKTGLIHLMEAMRYKDPADEAKILWITASLPGATIEGTNLSAVGSATWLDQGVPWAVFTLEQVVYNVDVSAYILQKGP